MIRLFILYSLFCDRITRGTRSDPFERFRIDIDDHFSGRVKAVVNWFSGLRHLFGFPEAKKFERILTSTI